MTTYFSTFITGLGDVVKEALRHNFPDIKIISLLDGLVIYQTTSKVDGIRKLRFVNNSYILLLQGRGSIEELISQIMNFKSLDKDIKKLLPGKRISFRIMGIAENHPLAINKSQLILLERKLATSELFVNRSNPHIEFALISRSEGINLFGLRLSRPKSSPDTLYKGQIRPELANLLICLSDPKSEDTFIDPFSGYGSIPIERAASFPYRTILAGETNSDLVRVLKEKARIIGKYFRVEEMDATNMKSISGESIDKIVTDPPWGKYSQIEVATLYPQMLTEFARVLKSGGLVVLLVADREFVDKYLLDRSVFRQEASYNILVSGNKAAIYKFRKV